VSTIVFCEDTPRIRKLIELAMRPTGHRVLLAGDGEAGLALIRAEHPELVVTDLAMPILDGTELFDSMRADPALTRIPVLFLTASTQRNLIAAAKERAPHALLAKPFSPADLRRAVDAALAGEPVAAAGGLEPC
jgi:CheY-like chemotaxis protein